MRLRSFTASAIVGFLSLCPISVASARSGPAEPPRSGWYIGATMGLNRASDMDQEGWNRDTHCYPTDACFDLDPIPQISGYRWRYNIEAAAGNVFEISAGRIFDRKRLELSLAQKKNGLNQVFRSVTDYDGMPMEERRGGTVESNDRSSIDDLIVRTLSFNAYYDFPDAYRGISPYLGGGLGTAYVEMSGVHYSNDHKETSSNAQVYDPPLSFYNSRQDGDLSDVVLAGHLHAGADYRVHDRTLLGLKLTYSITRSINVRGGYSIHPMHDREPDFPNHNTFTGARHWTLTLHVKRLFGN